MDSDQMQADMRSTNTVPINNGTEDPASSDNMHKHIEEHLSHMRPTPDNHNPNGDQYQNP